MESTGKTVYSIMNKINDKSYIGYCNNFKERKTRHLKSVSNGVNTHLYNAIRKYGSDSFDWIILFDNLSTSGDCKIMEKRMIALFDTYNNGYNSTLGGDGGDTFKRNGNKSTIKPGAFQKRNIPWNTGMTMSKEHCEKLSKAQEGLKRSKSHIENLRKARAGREISVETRKAAIKARRRPVRQLSLNKVVLLDYNSIVEANKITGINNISNVALGKAKSAGGFLWEFIEKPILKTNR